MKDKEEIVERLEEVDEKSSEAMLDSHKDEEISPVNRGAIYGWNEALHWVLGDDAE